MDCDIDCDFSRRASLSIFTKAFDFYEYVLGDYADNNLDDIYAKATIAFVYQTFLERHPISRFAYFDYVWACAVVFLCLFTNASSGQPKWSINDYGRHCNFDRRIYDVFSADDV